jgi:hypothetical protein
MVIFVLVLVNKYRRIKVMGNNMKAQSSEQLKRNVKIGKIILIVCWSAVVITYAVALYYGKTQVPFATSVGVFGLGVATIAMLIGGKRIKEELTRRSD